ncbi:MAG: C39 family peptidase [Nitrospirae bacterium]|nr:C39 family peptidase [Nitrospirota bacterium]
MSFYYNKDTNPAPAATTQFNLLPQIKAGKVPAYNQAKYEDAYDMICHHPDNDNLTIPCSTPGAVPYTIKRKGCFLTSAAMILSYHGVNVDPPTLNTWLKNKKSDNITPDGYDKNGNVEPRAVVAFAAEKGVTMAYPISEPTAGWSGYSSLERYLCTYGPHIIKPAGRPGHWVTATGRNPERTTYKINDPSGGRVTTLQERYNNNNYTQLRTFGGPEHTYTDRTGLTIRFHSPGELVITDPLGRRVGYDPTTGITYNEISDSHYESLYPDDDTEPYPTELLEQEYKELDISKPVAGDYKLQVIGTGTGNYMLDIRSWNPDLDSSISGWVRIFENVPITPNEVQIYGFHYAKTTTTALEFTAIDGNFDGKGQRPADVNKFLSYVTPTGSPVTLAQGTTSYTLVILYDKSIKAETFTAALNGSNVTSLFHPKAGSAEAVTVNINQGRNTLVLSVDGTLPGRTATDTDRLVFIVP